MEDKDFVPFETAKKLKAAGFDWTCQNFHIEKIPETEREEWDEDECQYATVYDIVKTPIPTLWQAQKWLRKVKRLHILVDFSYVGTWFYKVFPIVGCCINKSLFSYTTYEEALSAGIDAALELITNKTE